FIGKAPDYRYAGLFFHEQSGLYLAVFRAYDPRGGRWISRDLVGESGGVNLYRYAKNDPIQFSDFNGLTPNNKSVEAQCDYLYYKVDIPTCKAISCKRGKAAGTRCYKSASDRYAACLRGRSMENLPPLDAYNLNPEPMLPEAPVSPPLEIPEIPEMIIDIPIL
ncbi:RHS repeat-associated core domain-containing protein, partial [Acidithiobacillus sp. BN09-2]|nr:RHS repeat-associated core domain-containing protein [Acidithiobacillus sp. BN09-2]